VSAFVEIRGFVLVSSGHLKWHAADRHSKGCQSGLELRHASLWQTILSSFLGKHLCEGGGAVKVQDDTVTIRVKRPRSCYVERLLCEGKPPQTVEKLSELVRHDEPLTWGT
jgi:hypothetical protein